MHTAAGCAPATTMAPEWSTGQEEPTSSKTSHAPCAKLNDANEARLMHSKGYCFASKRRLKTTFRRQKELCSTVLGCLKFHSGIACANASACFSGCRNTTGFASCHAPPPPRPWMDGWMDGWTDGWMNEHGNEAPFITRRRGMSSVESSFLL